MNSINRHSVLLLIALLFIHLDIVLTWDGEFLAPSFPAFLVCGLALFFNSHLINRRSAEMLFVCILTIFATTAIQSIQYGDILDRLRSASLLSYTLLMGFGLMLLLESQGPSRVRKVVGMLLALLFVGTILERYTAFEAISTAVSQTLHGWNFVYDAAERDIRNYGVVRPKLFSSEPSKLGLTFALSISVFSVLNYRKSGLLASASICVLLSVLAAYLVRSPTILYGTAVALVMVASAFARERGASSKLVILMASIGFATIILTPYLLDLYIKSLQLGDNSLLTSRSWRRRIIYPAFFARDFLLDHPVLGSGFGGDVSLTKEMSHYFQIRGLFFVFPDLKGLSASHLVTNAFYLWFCQMGLLGSLLFIAPFRAFCRAQGVKYITLLLLCVALIWQTIGSISSPSSWMPVFFYIWLNVTIFGANRHVRHSRTGAEHPGRFAESRLLPGSIRSSSKARMGL